MKPRARRATTVYNAAASSNAFQPGANVGRTASAPASSSWCAWSTTRRGNRSTPRRATTSPGLVERDGHRAQPVRRPRRQLVDQPPAAVRHATGRSTRSRSSAGGSRPQLVDSPDRRPSSTRTKYDLTRQYVEREGQRSCGNPEVVAEVRGRPEARVHDRLFVRRDGKLQRDASHARATTSARPPAPIIVAMRSRTPRNGARSRTQPGSRRVGDHPAGGPPVPRRDAAAACSLGAHPPGDARRHAGSRGAAPGGEARRRTTSIATASSPTPRPARRRARRCSRGPERSSPRSPLPNQARFWIPMSTSLTAIGTPPRTSLARPPREAAAPSAGGSRPGQHDVRRRDDSGRPLDDRSVGSPERGARGARRGLRAPEHADALPGRVRRRGDDAGRDPTSVATVPLGRRRHVRREHQRDSPLTLVHLGPCLSTSRQSPPRLSLTGELLQPAVASSSRTCLRFEGWLGDDAFQPCASTMSALDVDRRRRLRRAGEPQVHDARRKHSTPRSPRVGHPRRPPQWLSPGRGPRVRWARTAGRRSTFGYGQTTCTPAAPRTRADEQLRASASRSGPHQRPLGNCHDEKRRA